MAAMAMLKNLASGESPRDGTTTGAVGPWRIPAVIAPQKSVMVL